MQSNLNNNISFNQYMDPITYLRQFPVIHENDLNCDMLSQLLYASICDRFSTTLDADEYRLLNEYQLKIYDFIDNCRELPVDDIGGILSSIAEKSYYLVDVVIMLWSCPRTDDQVSKRMYNNKYQDNIKRYNCKLSHYITAPFMREFCQNCLNRKTSVPIHCIDFIWFYMNQLTIELSFCNSNGASYITLTPAHHLVTLNFNLQYLYELGLGAVVYPVKGSFGDFLKGVLNDEELVAALLKSPTGSNLRSQLKAIQPAL